MEIYDFLLIIYLAIVVSEEVEYCPIKEQHEAGIDSSGCSVSKMKKRYILYDVNPPEGFNLRRDVYMRMAIFLKGLQKHGNWHLVLPPWGNLYHWQSYEVGRQSKIPWSTFFDIYSLNKFIPVIEMDQFLEEYGSSLLDIVFVLQHFEDAWEDGNWEEKYAVESCLERHPYRTDGTGNYSGYFWDYSEVKAREVKCLSFQGHISQLRNVLELEPTAHSVMFDHAEVALHDYFGDRTYWQARRSMRFASPLVALADEFRQKYLNSTDLADGTVRPTDWESEKPKKETKGGPYVCAHLRRKDFVRGRPKDVPSIKGAAKQLEGLLKKLNLSVIFIATDAPVEEFQELSSHLQSYRVLRYQPTTDVKRAYKDGGIAIIEQSICSHARYFIGTHESTFSFRIQEEREILGFSAETTFNRLCGDLQSNCSSPSKWLIVF